MPPVWAFPQGKPPISASLTAQKMSLLSVALATSGSRGQRLLFYYPTGTGEVKSKAEESSFTILKNLSPSLLGELLTPHSLLADKGFSLQVDRWRFVGQPKTVPSFKDGEDVRVLQFNVVFVLETSAEPSLVEQCRGLSDMLGCCLTHEERRCDYVSREVRALLNRVDYSNLQGSEDFGELYSRLAAESGLAACIVRLFNCVLSGATNITETVNNWSWLSWRQPRESSVGVQPFHSFLLFDDSDALIQSLPKEASPAFSKLLSVHSPIKTLQTLAEDCDLPLAHVLRLVEHLVGWGRACTIHPLVESNLYMLTDRADISRSSPLHDAFEKGVSSSPTSGHAPSKTFLKAASSFSQALPLADIQASFNQHEFVPMVAWMLRGHLITKLNTYVFLLAEDPPPPSPATTPPPEGSGCLESCGLREKERAAVQDCLKHKSPADIEAFCSLVQYFRGTCSVADMAQYELLRNSQILTIIDMFSSVLVTASIPDAIN